MKPVSKHMAQLKIIFGGFITAGLKLNSPKCSFWLKYIPYLVYVITREGINLIRRKYNRFWISGDLPLLLKRELSSLCSSTIEICGPGRLTY